MNVTGVFTATGQSASMCPEPRNSSYASPTTASMFNVSLWGTFVATVQIERSFDGGSTWLPITALGSSLAFTTPCSEIFEEPEGDVKYRLNCTAFTSGTVNYRISQ